VQGSYHTKDRSSFKENRQINTTIGSRGVIGIGTLELQVRRNPRDQSTHTLVLDDVLHLPGAICNGFSPELTGCNQFWGGGLLGRMQGYGKAGERLCYGTEFCGLSRLVLGGKQQGESELEKLSTGGAVLSLSIHLADEERRNLSRSSW
jgi:hypothetical protein